MFKISSLNGKTGTGFQVTFKNGLTVSVQWGPGTYSDNHGMGFTQSCENMNLQSRTAEVAVMDTNDPTAPFCTRRFGYSDDVVGHVTPNELVNLFLRVSEA